MIYCFKGVTDSNIQLAPKANFTIDDPRTREILHVWRILPYYSSEHYIVVIITFITLNFLEFPKKLYNGTENKDYNP